jgi:LuxR family maltose regulon positive regulatory protein
MTIVLDHLEHIASDGCHEALAEFAMRVPAGWQLALASRERLPIKVSRLRAQGNILELGPRELAMTTLEVEALLVGAGVEAPASWTDDLVRRTEGWPVGVYLAALAMEAGKPLGDAAFAGDDRWVSDYLRSELLARVDADRVDLLMRTSILDRLSGPLCDAVAGVTGAARALEDLAGQNMLVLPLDRHREWYRYHHLLRDHLLAELRVEHPDEMAQLHSRAASWYEANDMPEAALDHAQAAGDADRVAALILEHMSPVWGSGRVATVLGWMQWLEDHPSARHYAAVMAHGSLIYALLGRTGDAVRWANVAEQMPTGDALPDGSSVEGTLAYLRANLAREGVAAMRHDARVAQRRLDPGSPFQPTMAHVEGVSHLLEGDLESADTVLSRAYDLAVAFGSTPLLSLILAERSVVAMEGSDWTAADSFAQEALATVDDGGFDGYWTSGLVLATAARSAVHRGDMPVARLLVRRAVRLRPVLTYALPVVSVQALVGLAHASLGFLDHGGAAAALDQAAGILRQRPDLGNLTSSVDGLRARVGAVHGTIAGAASLTAAELRLVPLLPTHLSMAEIGERLHISRHTVKSEAISMYRKLGVSSRSAAVTRIIDLGLQP